jgi:hypothetical protein
VKPLRVITRGKLNHFFLCDEPGLRTHNQARSQIGKAHELHPPPGCTVASWASWTLGALDATIGPRASGPEWP